jgi:hypothetical protein
MRDCTFVQVAVARSVKAHKRGALPGYIRNAARDGRAD